MSRPTVLVLAGTAEGRAVAEALADSDAVAPVMSLAGLTEAEAPQNVVVRRGGFGGVGGLASYLRHGGIAAVIDATHPMAARMHHHAVEACRSAGVPCFRVQRREWVPEAGDRWHAVTELEAGFTWLRERATRVFATLGRRSMDLLAEQRDLHFLVRGMVRPPAVPANVTWIAGRPPFTVASEVALLRFHAVEALFVQASGGEATSDKLVAARELGLPVVLLARPQPPEGASGSVADAMSWLAALLGRRAGVKAP